MAVTLRQIAEATGLTYQTVGHVLNPNSPRRHLYSESTRQQVLEAAKRLGYVRNRIASSMARQRSHTLGVVVAFTKNEALRSMSTGISTLAGVEEVTAAADYNCLFSTSEMVDPEHFSPPRAMRDGSVDGVVLLGYTKEPILRKFAALGLPCVQVGSNIDLVGAVPRVYADLDAAFEQAARRLVGLGHRRIALVLDRGPGPLALGKHFLALQKRLPGFEPVLVEGDIQALAGDSAAFFAQRLLEMRSFPTAVMIASPLIQRLAQELAKAGKRCPEDVSLLGYGGASEQWVSTGFRTLRLSVIEPPASEVGRLAALRLLWRLDPPVFANLVAGGKFAVPVATEGSDDRTDWRIPCALHWHESCGAPANYPVSSRGLESSG